MKGIVAVFFSVTIIVSAFTGVAEYIVGFLDDFELFLVPSLIGVVNLDECAIGFFNFREHTLFVDVEHFVEFVIATSTSAKEGLEHLYPVLVVFPGIVDGPRKNNSILFFWC